MLDTLAADLKHAVSSLRHQRGFSAVVIVTLALGIGTVTAIFSVVNGVLLRPLAFSEPERVAMIWQTDRLTGTKREASSVPDFFDFKERNRTFEDVAAFAQTEVNFRPGDGDPERLVVARVTANLASLLGIAPVTGRFIDPSEDSPGGDRVALLSPDLWQRAFGSDPSVVGRELDLGDERYTVIGVLPGDLDFPAPDAGVWVPLQMGPTSAPRYNHWVQVVARLRAGTTLDDAQADMTTLAAALEEQYRENAARGAFVELLPDVLRGDVRPALVLLFAAVSAVLLIACVNVSNLHLARGAARSQELALCLALGAGRFTLLRRFLVENLILVGIAALTGIGLARFGVRALMTVAPPEVAALGPVTLDARVLAFGGALSFLIAVGFAVVHAVQARRLDVSASLKEGRGPMGGARRTAVRKLLVQSQMSLATMLLSIAALLVQSLTNLQSVDPGFRAESLLRLDYHLPESRYPRDFAVYPRWAEVQQFNRAILERVRGLSGVRSAALTSNHPLDSGFTNSFVIVGREDEAKDQGELKTRLVSDGYFETAGVGLRAGRFLDGSDRVDALPVLVLNEAAVARYFADRSDTSVLGQKVRFWGFEREIVGIVANERMHGLGEPTPPAMYVPLGQAPQLGAVTLMLKATVPSEELVAPVRAALWDLDPGLAAYNVATMEETLALSVAKERFTSWLLTVFAAFAVLLASIGVHGVLSYLVAQRRRDIGLRMALGARRADVVAQVTTEGLWMSVLGVVSGAVVAFFAARLLAGELFGVTGSDPALYLLVAVALLAVATLASYVPARRAAGIDPLQALRSE